MMNRPRIALGIRAQLLLVLTVFLAIPWLGYEYVRELERFLRDAQERTLAGTAQAVATALARPTAIIRGAHRAVGIARFRSRQRRGNNAAQCACDDRARLAGDRTDHSRPVAHDRAHLGCRPRAGRACARRQPEAGGTRPLSTPPPCKRRRSHALDSGSRREVLQPLYARVLQQPTEDFSDERSGRAIAAGKDVEGALAGILTVERRPTADGKAVIVSAAHPIWVGDEVKGAVIVEETTNAVLAERNRAFARLFNIVLAALLIGSVALTLYASWLSTRIRRLRDEAEAAIDAQGRVRGMVTGSNAGDEIGDLARSFREALARLAQYASYQEAMASRLSHELRTPIAVVRSSLDALRMQPLPDEARVYMERAQQGLNRLAHILTRMTEATRLEQSLADAERERFDLARVIAGCVDGYRAAYPQQAHRAKPARRRDPL